MLLQSDLIDTAFGDLLCRIFYLKWKLRRELSVYVCVSDGGHVVLAWKAGRAWELEDSLGAALVPGAD